MKDLIYILSPKRGVLLNSLLILLLSIFVWSCSEDEPVAPNMTEEPTIEEEELLKRPHLTGTTDIYDSDVAVAWFNLAYDLVQAEGWSPPVVSRVFGYTGVTLYEAVVPGMPDYQSLTGQLNELKPIHYDRKKKYHWPTVANAALAGILKKLFKKASSTTLGAIDDMEDQFRNEFKSNLPRSLFKRSVSHGKQVAKQIHRWSSSDGFNKHYNCAYTPPIGSGLWILTPPAYASALEPCWGKIRPFVIDKGSVCDPGPPPAYSEDPSSDFYIEATEVYDTVDNLTQEQLDIALYWADDPGYTGTPPGHSISITSQILVQEGYSLDVAAESYSKVGMSIADAFIACWWSKYQYNLIRPISYIMDVMNPTWPLPPVTTPPFPEYTSGHSVQSGAASQVLTDVFGDIPFTDHTHNDLGMAPRSFNTFYEMADEAAISRLYGGIHFRAAIDLGIEQGRCVGEQISALAFFK